MIRQYGAQRFRPMKPMIPVTKGKGKRAKITYVPQPDDIGYKYRVGTIPVGTIVYIQDNVRVFGGVREPAVLRNPWMVMAWLNREYHPATSNKPHTTYMSGGHLAVVKSLRDGRVQHVADWILLACCDADLDCQKNSIGGNRSVFRARQQAEGKNEARRIAFARKMKRAA